MPNSTLTALTSATALTGAELLYAVQSGLDRKATATQIATFTVAPILNSSPVFVGELSPPVLANGLDQTANLQAAIDTYTAASGAILQFGAGTYLFNSAIILKPNVILRGIGIDMTILKVAVDNINLIDTWAAKGNETGVSGLSDLTVWGYGDRNLSQGTNKLVNMGPFSYYWMRNVKAIYSRNMSLCGTGTVGIADSCIVNQGYRDGINLGQTDNVTITNCEITQVGDDAIAVPIYNGEVGVHEYSVRIVGNRIEKANGIKVLGARHAVISDNVLRFYYGYGVYVGLDAGAGEGYGTKINVSITGNSLLDGMNNTVVGGGSVNSAILVTGGQSLGSGGNAIPVSVGAYSSSGAFIQKPDVFINQFGPTQPRGPDGTIAIVGNTIRETLSGMTNFADSGFGNLWNSTGSINPAVTTLIRTMTGIYYDSDQENLIITGNTMHGLQYGIHSDGQFNNVSILGNTIFRTSIGIFLNPAVTTTNGSVDISNNLIDIDPYLESASRTSPIDGTWTATDGSTDMAIMLTSFNGASITRNRIRNCIRPIKANVWYIHEKNIIEFDWSGGTNKGISFVGDANVDAAADLFWWCDSVPSSSTFNRYNPTFLVAASTIPSSGYYYQGHFVKNWGGTLSSSVGYTLLGWYRLTSGNSHTAGTDWSYSYVRNTST